MQELFQCRMSIPLLGLVSRLTPKRNSKRDQCARGIRYVLTEPDCRVGKSVRLLEWAFHFFKDQVQHRMENTLAVWT